MTAVHVLIEGRVQGVGFRAWVEREAKARRLSGWVRNCSGGGGEAVFSGAGVWVCRVVEGFRRGGPVGRVKSVKTSIHPDEKWTEFVVWPTA